MVMKRGIVVFGLTLLVLIIMFSGCAKKPSEIVVQASPLETVTKSLIIKNLADKPVTMPTSATSEYISVPSTISFGPNEEREIDVLVTPEKEGEWTETLTIGENKFTVKILSEGEPAMTKEQYETAKKRASDFDISLGSYNVVDKKARRIFKEGLGSEGFPDYVKYSTRTGTKVIIAYMYPTRLPSPEIHLELTDDGKIKVIAQDLEAGGL